MPDFIFGPPALAVHCELFCVEARFFGRKFDPCVPALRVRANTCACGVTFVLLCPAQIRPTTRATAVAQHSGYRHTKVFAVCLNRTQKCVL